MNLQKLNFLIITIFFQLSLLPTETAISELKRTIDKTLEDGYDEISYDYFNNSILKGIQQNPQSVVDIKLALESGIKKFSERSTQKPFYAHKKMDILHKPVQGLYQAGLMSAIVGGVLGCVCLVPRLVIGDTGSDSNDLIDWARKSFVVSSAGLVTAIYTRYYWEEIIRTTRHFDAAEANSKTLKRLITLIPKKDN